MKATARLWAALVVGVLVAAIPARSWAGPLTTVDKDTFKSWIGNEEGPPILSGFDFEPGPGPDGMVMSVVYQGTEKIGGLYVYVYQISHCLKSSEENISGMSFDVKGPVSFPRPPLNEGSFAFQVEGTGDTGLSDATFFGTPIRSVRFLIPNLAPNKSTWLFGFFSPVKPTIVTATVLDTGNGTILFPSVYTPSPEPSMFALLGLGIFGAFFVRRRLL